MLLLPYSNYTIIITYLLLSLLLFLEFVVVGHTFRARVLFWVSSFEEESKPAFKRILKTEFLPYLGFAFLLLILSQPSKKRNEAKSISNNMMSS